MKNKPFLATLSIASLIGAVITKLCLNTLGSGEEPRLVTMSFEGMQRWLTRGVPLVSLVLLLLQTRAHVLRQTSGWLFVLCWLYFATFTAIDYVWLSDAVFRHTKSTGTWEGGFNAMGIIGLALILAFGLMCGAGYLVAKSMRPSSAE